MMVWGGLWGSLGCGCCGFCLLDAQIEDLRTNGGVVGGSWGLGVYVVDSAY